MLPLLIYAALHSPCKARSGFAITLIYPEFVTSPNRSYVVLKYCPHARFPAVIPSHRGQQFGRGRLPWLGRGFASGPLLETPLAVGGRSNSQRRPRGGVHRLLSCRTKGPPERQKACDLSRTLSRIPVEVRSSNSQRGDGCGRGLTGFAWGVHQRKRGLGGQLFRWSGVLQGRILLVHLRAL